VNHDPWGNPVEIFINVGKAGSDVQAMAEALGRIISKSVRFGSQLTAKERTTVIIDQLKGIGGRRSVGFGPNKVLSLPDAVAMALSSHLGIRFNGHIHETNGNGVHTNGHLTNGNEESKVEIQSDLAGAVMSAQIPARQDSAYAGDDHTTATAESHLTPADAVDQLALSDDIIPKVADICPSCGASSLVYEEGCMKCYSCGHSEC
jgi:ribonucleoside-diphosphate reductase alpha chain